MGEQGEKREEAVGAVDETQREKRILVNMLHQLLQNLQAISQRGAGYYTVSPHIEKFNKLLGKTRELFGEHSLIDTFEPIEDKHYTDPADKEKQAQRVILEISQLIAFVEAAMSEE